MTTTKTANYKALAAAIQSWNEAKEQLESLKATGENAARATGSRCKGSMAEKLEATRVACEPFKQNIAEAEYTVMLLHAKVDEARKTYKMCK